MKSSEIDETETVKKVYQYYGTDSGVLFGLQSGLRRSIEAVIIATIRVIKSEYPDKEGGG